MRIGCVTMGHHVKTRCRMSHDMSHPSAWDKPWLGVSQDWFLSCSLQQEGFLRMFKGKPTRTAHSGTVRPCGNNPDLGEMLSEPWPTKSRAPDVLGTSAHPSARDPISFDPKLNLTFFLRQKAARSYRLGGVGPAGSHPSLDSIDRNRGQGVHPLIIAPHLDQPVDPRGQAVCVRVWMCLLLKEQPLVWLVSKGHKPTIFGVPRFGGAPIYPS